MNYTGEHLLPGQLGHFFIILSLVSSLIASFSYFKSVQAIDTTDKLWWKKIARYSFYIDCISVFSIFSILVYIIANHYFEYQYAWQHSSLALEPKYLLASIWEGQEGSFLLWTLWHCVLGLVFIWSNKEWEGPVMTIVSFAQLCLATMVTGLYFFGWKMGSNPFLLLRDAGVLDAAPAMHVNFDVTQPFREDYLTMIKDGNDLNPLLQNYWMVIHPPVLFMGFASTLIPFALAMAGLWTGVKDAWVKVAQPWALFSLAVLGVGIMMGGAWAYESLNFGGYWAWDPVENASLVPWLTLAAGVHTALIFSKTGYSLRSTYIFYGFTFFFVLYSTFLTRSGILGDSSVHAFTDLGMNAQLFLFMYAFIWLAAYIAAPVKQQKLITLATAIILAFAAKLLPVQSAGFMSMLAGVGVFLYFIQKAVPTIKKEENSSSREFWMFIGSLVLFLSAIIIIAKTSLPVFNKSFGTRIAAPEDEGLAYNQIQIFVAIILALLTAIGQYLKYKGTPTSYLLKKISLPTIVAAILATLVLVFGKINYEKHGIGFLIAIWIAVACTVYTIVANALYIWIGIKGKLSIAGGSIAHFGFGLTLLGILLSSSKKEILSINTSGIEVPFSKDSGQNPGENLTLVQGLPTRMGKFNVTYVKDSVHPKKSLWFYELHFKSTTDNEEFTLWPNAFVNYKGNQQLMANPDSKHYLHQDIFTYITSLAPQEKKDTTAFKLHAITMGDTVFYSKGIIKVEKIVSKSNLPFQDFKPGDVATVATLRVYSKNNTSYPSELLFIKQKDGTFSASDTLFSQGLVLQLQDVKGGQATLGVKESDAMMQFLTLKAYRFPFINVLWLGIIITAIGILMSMVQRMQRNKLRAV